MLELINQLDGFDPRGNIKVIVPHTDLAQMPILLLPKLPHTDAANCQNFQFCCRCWWQQTDQTHLTLPWWGQEGWIGRWVFNFSDCWYNTLILQFRWSSLCQTLTEEQTFSKFMQDQWAWRRTLGKHICFLLSWYSCTDSNVKQIWWCFSRYELLARLCPNSTGAELRSVCTEAGMFAIRWTAMLTNDMRRKIATGAMTVCIRWLSCVWRIKLSLFVQGAKEGCHREGLPRCCA